MPGTNTQYFSLIPSEFKLDGGAMFGIIPKPLWEKKIPADETNRINMALRVLLIRTANRIILIDSGVGGYHDSKFQERHGVNSSKSPLISLLGHLSISPEQVTDLIPSHLHFDHVGGYINPEGSSSYSLFPEATLHLHKKHYEYSLRPSKRDHGSFQAQFFEPFIQQHIQNNRVNWLDEGTKSILEDDGYTLNYRCSHGHTPFQIHPYDEKMIFMADLVPTSAHISPVWVMGYDMKPGVSPDEREEFYQFIQDQNLTMIYDHDLNFWGSHVEKNGNRFKAIDLHPQLSHCDQVLTKL